MAHAGAPGSAERRRASGTRPSRSIALAVIARLRSGLGAPAARNLGAAFALKGGGLVYSMAIVGLASRSLSAADTASLLLAFNFVVPLGLVEAGLGTMVFRVVAHAHARGERIDELDAVAGAFWTTFALAVLAAVAAGTAFVAIGFGFLVPVALIMLCGMVCSTADQIRAGTERGWVSNLFLGGAYLACAVAYGVVRVTAGAPNLAVAAILTYGAPGLAAIASFAAMARGAAFRRLLARGRRLSYGAILRPTAPIFLVSLGSALLLNVPASGSLLGWFPALAHDDVVLLRLCTLVLNTCWFLSTPILPTLVRHRHAGDAATFRRSVALFAGTFALVTIAACLAFAFGASAFARLWLGRGIADPSRPFAWAVVLLPWLPGAAAAQYVVMAVSPARVAIVLLACDAIVILAPLASYLHVPVGVATAMTAGLLVYCGGSAITMARDVRRTLRDKRAAR